MALALIIYNMTLASLIGGLLVACWKRRHRARLMDSVLLAAVPAAVAMMLAMCFRSISRFGQIQLLAWAIFVHYPFFLGAIGLIMWQHNRRLSGLMLVVTLGIITIGIEAFVIEPNWLVVTRTTLKTDKLSEPLRLVILADIQTDRIGAYELRVIRQVAAEKPDLILFAGDYLQSADSTEYGRLVSELNNLLQRHLPVPTYGTFAVRGNVEHATWTGIFADLPIETFVNRSTEDLGPVLLTGLTLEDSTRPDLSIQGSEKFHIVLGHAPGFSLGQVDADLLIAGHTHGGQVQLPFLGPIVTMSHVPRSWASGKTALGSDRTLIVSRGIGMERDHAPPIRFFCRPELVVVDLIPAGGLGQAGGGPSGGLINQPPGGIWPIWWVMDTSVFSDIWVFVASMAGLAGVTYLRALAIGRRNQIELHNCAREAVKMHEHFQTQQRLRKMTRGAIIED